MTPKHIMAPGDKIRLVRDWETSYGSRWSKGTVAHFITIIGHREDGSVIYGAAFDNIESEHVSRVALEADDFEVVIQRPT